MRVTSHSILSSTDTTIKKRKVMKWTEFFKRKVGSDTNEALKENVQPTATPTGIFTFSEDGKSVKVEGIAELAEYGEGVSRGEGMAAFYGNGNDKTIVLVNTNTGKIRKIRDAGGSILVSDAEMDYKAIDAELEHPGDAHYKCSEYYFGFYDDFENGYTALAWTTHPDGMYYMDEDGFGMEPDSEENIYCIINSDLEIVVPFKPMDTRAVLEKFRRGERQ